MPYTPKPKTIEDQTAKAVDPATPLFALGSEVTVICEGITRGQMGKIVKFHPDSQKYEVSFDEQWRGWYSADALHQGPPSREAIQYADYILNHYSRDSYSDKICLARDLEAHGWANTCVSDGPADAHKSPSSAEGPFAARNG